MRKGFIFPFINKFALDQAEWSYLISMHVILKAQSDLYTERLRAQMQPQELVLSKPVTHMKTTVIKIGSLFLYKEIDYEKTKKQLN